MQNYKTKYSMLRFPIHSAVKARDIRVKSVYCHLQYKF